MTASTTYLDRIGSLLAEKGYEVSAQGSNVLRIREVTSGVAVQAVLQGETLGVSIGKILRDLAIDMRKARRQSHWAAASAPSLVCTRVSSAHFVRAMIARMKSATMMRPAATKKARRTECVRRYVITPIAAPTSTIEASRKQLIPYMSIKQQALGPGVRMPA